MVIGQELQGNQKAFWMNGKTSIELMDVMEMYFKIALIKEWPEKLLLQFYNTGSRKSVCYNIMKWMKIKTKIHITETETRGEKSSKQKWL